MWSGSLFLGREVGTRLPEPLFLLRNCVEPVNLSGGDGPCSGFLAEQIIAILRNGRWGHPLLGSWRQCGDVLQVWPLHRGNLLECFRQPEVDGYDSRAGCSRWPAKRSPEAFRVFELTRSISSTTTVTGDCAASLEHQHRQPQAMRPSATPDHAGRARTEGLRWIALALSRLDARRVDSTPAIQRDAEYSPRAHWRSQCASRSLPFVACPSNYDAAFADLADYAGCLRGWY